MLCFDNQGYKIEDGVLRFPVKPRHHCSIKLTPYVLKQLENTKLGSITITTNKLIISFSKEVAEKEPEHFVGIDRNLDNATSFDSTGKFMIYNLRKTTKIKQKYKMVKSHFRRNDVRIKKKIFAKYGTKEKNRVNQLLHNVSKKIVSDNKGIILEDIKGIRRLYQKGNGQGKKVRGRMNSWSFYELQRQLEYKSRGLGLPVIYVRAAGTSSMCAICGSKAEPEEHRLLFCPNCNTVVDRDINAAKNILTRGLRLRPDALQGEAVKQSKDAKQIAVSQVVCKTKT